MKERTILLLDSEESPWKGFLEEFLEDSCSKLVTTREPITAGTLLLEKRCDVAFVNPDLFSGALRQKLKVYRQSVPDFRVFQIGMPVQKQTDVPFDGCFETLPPLSEFQRKVVSLLPLQDLIRVLVVDDEKEIGDMVQDFLGGRSQPSFQVTHVENGEKGLQTLESEKPDVVLLDIKMPVKDGRQVYREMKQSGCQTPVIIFFDSISGDEMLEIHKFGNPAVVEKGSGHSAMPEMMDLIKKLSFFR